MVTGCYWLDMRYLINKSFKSWRGKTHCMAAGREGRVTGSQQGIPNYWCQIKYHPAEAVMWPGLISGGYKRRVRLHTSISMRKRQRNWTV